MGRGGRGWAKVAAGLEKWVAGLGREEEFARLQALWTYQTINVPHVGLLKELLRAKDSGIRVAATRVLGAWVGPDRPLAEASLTNEPRRRDGAKADAKVNG